MLQDRTYTDQSPRSRKAIICLTLCSLVVHFCIILLLCFSINDKDLSYRILIIFPPAFFFICNLLQFILLMCKGLNSSAVFCCRIVGFVLTFVAFVANCFHISGPKNYFGYCSLDKIPAILVCTFLAVDFTINIVIVNIYSSKVLSKNTSTSYPSPSTPLEESLLPMPVAPSIFPERLPNNLNSNQAEDLPPSYDSLFCK